MNLNALMVLIFEAISRYTFQSFSFLKRISTAIGASSYT